MSAGSSHTAICAFLISKGARENIRNWFGWTCKDGLRFGI
jgi:hypothetical protein